MNPELLNFPVVKGVKHLIEEFDKLYVKDKDSADEAYEQSEKYCRPKSMSTNNSIIKFEQLNKKIKNVNMALLYGMMPF